jgi:PAS domain S-box-containing protein
MVNYFRTLLTSPTDQDPSFLKLFQTILIFATLAFAAIAVMLAITIPSDTHAWYSSAAVLVMALLSGVSLYFSRRGVLWPGKLLLPLSGLAAVVFIAFQADGMHDTAIVGFPVVIVIACLITGQKAVPPVTFLTLLGVWFLAYADLTGLTHTPMAKYTGIADIANTSILLLFTAGSLHALMNILNKSVARAQANEQAQVVANQELIKLKSVLEQRVNDRTRALATSTEISRRISTIMNPRQLLAEVVSEVQSAFGYYHAQIYLMDEARQNLVLAAGSGQAGVQMLAKGDSIPLDHEQSFLARAARERGEVIVEDLRLAPGYLPNPLLPEARSELAVPMILGDEVVGVFDVQSDQIGGFSDADLNVQKSLAAQISVAVQNTRRYMESLQFKLGIENSADAVFITDRKGTIIYANPAFEKVYGFTPAEVIGKTPRIIKSGLLTQENYQMFWGALLAKTSVSGEIINKRKDGHLIYVVGTNSAILDDSGEIIGFLAVHHDISESKRDQEALSKRASELATVAEVGTVASTILDTGKLLQYVVDLTKERLDLYHAHIYLLDESGENLVLAAGAGDAGRKMAANGHSIPLNREQSLVARAARERTGVRANDVTEAPDFLPNPLLPNTRAELAVPMIVGEDLIGVFDVQSELVGRFTDADINIQTTMATQVATSVQNAKILAQAQRQAEREATLNAINQKIQSATTVEAALKIAARELGHALGKKATLVTLDPAVLAGGRQSN